MEWNGRRGGGGGGGGGGGKSQTDAWRASFMFDQLKTQIISSGGALDQTIWDHEFFWPISARVAPFTWNEWKRTEGRICWSAGINEWIQGGMECKHDQWNNIPIAWMSGKQPQLRDESLSTQYSPRPQDHLLAWKFLLPHQQWPAFIESCILYYGLVVRLVRMFLKPTACPRLCIYLASMLLIILLVIYTKYQYLI